MAYACHKIGGQQICGLDLKRYFQIHSIECYSHSSSEIRSCTTAIMCLDIFISCPFPLQLRGRNASDVGMQTLWSLICNIHEQQKHVLYEPSPQRLQQILDCMHVCQIEAICMYIGIPPAGKARPLPRSQSSEQCFRLHRYLATIPVQCTPCARPACWVQRCGSGC